MARPRKKGMAYFPHDCDASNDDKIEALRAIHGNDGYAFYFILLERVFSKENPGINIGLPAIKLALIKKVGVTPEKFDAILETALDVGAFDKEIYSESSILTSNGVKQRFKIVEDLRASWRDKKSKSVISPENSEENTGKIPQKKKEKKKENIYNIYSAEYSLAAFLFSEICKNNSTFKEPNLQKWAYDMDLLLRIDRRPPEEVRAVILFAQSDPFWKTNILSVGKLRKQYDTLKMQMEQKNPRNNSGSASSILGLGEEVRIEI